MTGRDNQQKIKAINIVFDGPPNHMPGRFAGVETDEGLRINAGKWAQREDGSWVLRITELPAKVAEPTIAHKLPVDTLVEVWGNAYTDVHKKRYWKCYGDKGVECFTNGKTSQTRGLTSIWRNYRILDNPWMAWLGGECPVAPWVKVQVRYRDDDMECMVEAKRLTWSYSSPPKDIDIIEFKIVKQEVPR